MQPAAHEPEATYCLHKTIMWRILLFGWFVINLSYNLMIVGEAEFYDPEDIASLSKTANSSDITSRIVKKTPLEAILDSYKYLTNWSELLTVFYCGWSFFCCIYSKCNVIYGTDFYSITREEARPGALRISSLLNFSDELQKMASNVALLVTVLYYSLDSPKWDYIFVNKHLISSIMLTLDQVAIGYRRINFVGFNFRLLTNNNREHIVPGTGRGDDSDDEDALSMNAASVPIEPYTGARPSFRVGGLTMTWTQPSLTFKQYYGTALFLAAYAITNMTISLRTRHSIYPFLDWNANFGQCLGLTLMVGLIGVPFANFYYYLVYFASREAQCCSGELDVIEYRRLLREEM